MRMTEEHLNPEGRRQPPMFGHFAALIVGQGLAERRRDAAQCAGEALVSGQSIVAFQLAQANTPGRAFVENAHCQGGLGLPDDEIAFPMPDGSSIIGVDRTFRHETFNPGATRDGGISRLPVRTPVPSQALDQVTLEFASGQEVNRTIDRLVAHAHLRSVRVVFFQTAGRLFRGQAPAQGANDVTPQAVPLAVRWEPSGTTRHLATAHRLPLGGDATVRLTLKARDFATDRARGATECAGDRPRTPSLGHADRNLLSFFCLQVFVSLVHLQLLYRLSS